LSINGGRIDIVRSHTRDERLQDWLSTRSDRLVRISMALRGATDDTPAYDVYIIDTQGAVGHLRDAAVNAADVLITPWCATSFQHASSLQAPCNCSNAMNRWSMGYKVPAMKAVINLLPVS